MTTALPETLADKLISEKIEEWRAKKHPQHPGEEARKLRIYPFLTVARDIGCGEEIILPQLEKTLGWKIYGKNLLDYLAGHHFLSRSFIETLDENRQNLLDNWVNFLIHSGAILQKNYVLKISRLIKVIAAHESAIFLGRGANFILKNRKEGVRIKLTAPFSHRVEHIRKLKDIDPKEAERMVREIDREREAFIRYYFDKQLEEDFEFDIVFNTMTIDTNTLCNIVRDLLLEK